MVSGLFKVLFIGLISSQALAEITFGPSVTETQKQETLERIEWIHSQLPQDWPRPKDFSLVFTQEREASYSPNYPYMDNNNLIRFIPKLIIVDGPNSVQFIHEYAHLVFDVYLRKNSVPWQYYLVWQKNQYKDLQTSYEDNIHQLTEVRKTNKETRQQKADGDTDPFLDKIIATTDESIIRIQKDIDEQKEVLEAAQTYPHPLDQINSFQAIIAYNELFADTLTVLLLENWQVIRNSYVQEFANTDLKKRIILPPLDTMSEAIEAYLDHRDFRKAVTLESYEFKDWEAESEYYQFAPIRSMMVDLKDESGKNNQEVLEILLTAIVNVYHDELIAQPENMERSLYEKNISLRDQILNQL